MKRTLLIVNANSGSASAIDDQELVQALRAGGFDVVRRASLPAEQLPDRASLDGIDAVAILSGDGTVSSLCQNLAGWAGEVLVLPGGTMNLLSRRLHGGIALAPLVAKIGVEALEAFPMPVIYLGKREIFTGLTVGPSTRWGEVREDIRHGDVAALAEKVPVAWSETLAETGVWIAGDAGEPYAGIFVEPGDGETLSVIAFRANNLGDMVGHGVAWLRRDFREGPRDDLGAMREVTIFGDDAETGLLIDGEYEDGRLPLTCTAGMSSMKFLRVT